MLASIHQFVRICTPVQYFAPVHINIFLYLSNPIFTRNIRFLFPLATKIFKTETQCYSKYFVCGRTMTFKTLSVLLCMLEQFHP